MPDSVPDDPNPEPPRPRTGKPDADPESVAVGGHGAPASTGAVRHNPLQAKGRAVDDVDGLGGLVYEHRGEASEPVRQTRHTKAHPMTQPNANVYQGDDGEYHWRVQAANGEIVATGEGHTTRHDAERAMLTALETFWKAAGDKIIDEGGQDEQA